MDEQSIKKSNFDETEFQNTIWDSYKKVKNNKKLRKYYVHRYQLFTKFDNGIVLDSKESWYSVTPEKVAEHIALKCFERLNSNSNLIILDAFSGCGGNTIQFAKLFNCVYALDIDMQKLLCAKINAKIYQVHEKIEFICEDFFHYVKNFNSFNLPKPDVIFLSPPWGGVNYMNGDSEISLNEFPLDGNSIFENALKLCKNIIYFLPRNCNIENCISLLNLNTNGDSKNEYNFVELEQNFLDYKLIALTAYYGDLVKNNKEILN